MSVATRYWVWESTGPYYGMPWLNLLGWFVTGVLLLTAMSGLRADAWIARLSPQWLLVWFGLNLLLPLGLCGAAGFHGAVAASLSVLALAGGWLLSRQVPVAAVARVEERASR
jgi:putative membrane protein